MDRRKRDDDDLGGRGSEHHEGGPVEPTAPAVSDGDFFPDQNPSPVFRVSAAGEIIYANHCAESVARHWDSGPGRNVPPVICEHVRAALRDRKIVRFTAAAGSATYLFHAAPVAGKDYVHLYGADITDHLQVERDLAEREADLKRAQAIGQVGSWRMDVRRNQLLWSDENHRIFGVPKGPPMTYETFLSVVHPDDREYVHAKWSAALRGEDYDIEHRIVVDGQIKWVRELVELEADERGEIIGGFGTTQDITKRMQDREAVLHAKEEWEETFDTVPDLIAILDTDRRIVRANRAMADRLGTTPAACVGKFCYEVVHGSSIPPEFCPHAATCSDGREHTEEVEERNLGGTFLVTTTPRFDKQGVPRGSVHVARDITERKRIETELRRLNATLEARVHERTSELEVINRELRESAAAVRAERQRFNEVLENLPIFTVLVTPDYRISFANRFYRDRFGEAGGRRCYERLFGRTEPCEVCEAFTVFQDGIPRHWVWNGPDGRVYDNFAFPFNDVDGSPMMMEVGVDITKRKQAETKLHTLADRLRALTIELVQTEDRERQRLAQVLHDNLQQTLAAAKISTTILRKQLHDTPHEDQAGKIVNLLSAAIKTSRSLTIELFPPVLHRAGLIEALEWLAGCVRDEHGLEVTIDAADRVRDLAVPEAIRLFMFQAARELLFNVVKHAGVNCARVVVTHQPDGWLCLDVVDAGAGLPPVALEGDGKYSGSFGLFSIRERLVHFGGNMEIASGTDEGTTVRLRVPIPKRASSPAASTAAAAAAPPAATARETIKIVVVDDHSLVRKGLVELLQKEADFEIVGEAADGYEALELSRRLRPDVVTMDVSMPRLDGPGATELICAEMPEIAVIALSMFAQTDSEERMRLAGARDFLAKDGPVDDLIAAVRAAARPLDPGRGPRG